MKMKHLKFIFLLLLIVCFSCKEQGKKIEPKSTALYNLNDVIMSGKSNEQTYSKLDSLKKIVDGADGELYIEIYKNAIVYDIENFKKFNLKNELNQYVISFFSQSNETLDSINFSIKKIYPKSLFIHDSDGFVNLRKQPNSQSEIILKIKSNEMVNIIATENNWFKIYYKGNIGYVHRSRLFETQNSTKKKS